MGVALNMPSRPETHGSDRGLAPLGPASARPAAGPRGIAGTGPGRDRPEHHMTVLVREALDREWRQAGLDERDASARDAVLLDRIDHASRDHHARREMELDHLLFAASDRHADLDRRNTCTLH